MTTVQTERRENYLLPKTAQTLKHDSTAGFILSGRTNEHVSRSRVPSLKHFITICLHICGQA